MRLFITVVAGPHQGKVYVFSGHDTFLVGRGKQVHFRLPREDEYFSRVHFMVEVNPPACRLMDMGSTNGTYVNGQKVSMADLENGDLIQGGQTALRVTVEGDDSEMSTRHGAVPLVGLPATESFGVKPPPAAASLLAEPTSSAAPKGCFLPALEQGSLDHLCVVCSSPAPRSAVLVLCPDCHRESSRRPQPLPGFWVLREIGKGGMGVVYLAVRVCDGRLTALKTLKPAVAAGPTEMQRFLREVKILGELRHPHIVSFEEAGEAAGQVYFVMEYVRANDASKVLAKQGPLPVGRAANLVCQLLEALAYAHGKRFVHRDIKPANLLILEENDRDTLKVIDFGLARTYQASRLSGLTVTGAMGGTVPFMAPEQITNFREAKPPVDQYAAAATFYNLLTSRHIHDFPRDSHSRLLKILQDEPVPIHQRRPDIPEGLAAAIHKALAREPENRYADVVAFRQALLPFAATEPGR